MTSLKLREQILDHCDVFNFYCDVFLHCANGAIIKAHKIILAQHSSFLHKFFLSRKGLMEVDMFFPNLQECVVKKSVDIMYGRTVEVDEVYRKRVCAFLRMLQVEFEIVTDTAKETTEEIVNLDRTFEKPEIFVTPSTSKELLEPVLAEPSEKVVENMVIETEEEDPEILNLNDWTVTTATDNRVSMIDHSWERLKNKKRNKYTCDHCAETCYSIKKAETHFIRMHLDIGLILELMADIDMKRKKYQQEFTQLVQLFHKPDRNAFLVRHEMEVISDNLKELRSMLNKNTSKKLLPQHEQRKKNLEINLITLESDLAKVLRDSFN